eukprot:scaffold161367_cov20-Tisochrysis_lutea.AAC.5
MAAGEYPLPPLDLSSTSPPHSWLCELLSDRSEVSLSEQHAAGLLRKGTFCSFVSHQTTVVVHHIKQLITKGGGHRRQGLHKCQATLHPRT